MRINSEYSKCASIDLRGLDNSFTSIGSGLPPSRLPDRACTCPAQSRPAVVTRARRGDGGPGRGLVCKPHSNLCNSGARRRPAIGRVPALRPGTICRNGNSSGATFGCLARQHRTTVVGTIAHRWEMALAGMTPDDLASLRRAVQSLEHPSLAARLTNMVGKPIEPPLRSPRPRRTIARHLQGSTLPQRGSGTIQRPARSRLFTAPWPRHQGGGPLRLPSRRARDRSCCGRSRRLPGEGRDLSSSETALCVQVFALGGGGWPMLPKADADAHPCKA
jgi:hypothetical protein